MDTNHQLQAMVITMPKHIHIHTNQALSSKRFCIFFLAWGSNDFVTPGESSGFDADGGFDSFLAMQAPPEVSAVL